MNKKKLLWIAILVIFVIVIITILNVAKPKKVDKNTTGNNSFNKTNSNGNEITDSIINNIIQNEKYIKVELDDGTLYTLTGEKIEADIVIGDNYYDTTISDMYLNPEDYENKYIEVEGMYLENPPYKFVGRYSSSNLCAFCPPGYSYVEYQLAGIMDKELTPEKDWIKIIGTLEKGIDETLNNQEFYYIKALNIEIMNERGLDTVKN